MTVKSFYQAIPRKWRTPKTILSLFVIELLITVAALALYGIAAPDLYRTKLWREGSNHGWNSNPNEILYAYANYRPIKYPTPWDGSTTRFNVIIAVLSIFLLLVKGIMFITHCFDPILSVLVHAALIALYAVSIHNQAASDMSDPKHPQSGPPWYITKSCGAPVNPSLNGYCKQAKGTFAVTILLCILFFIYLTLSLFSLYPTKAHRVYRRSKIPEEESMQSPRPWEMINAPHTPGTTGGLKSPDLRSPTTPRTMAFETLSGHKAPAKKANSELPLRHHISMGDETYSGPSNR